MNSQDFEFVSQLLRKRAGIVLSGDKMYLLESRLAPLARKEDSFESSEVQEQDNHVLPTGTPVRKTRARSLIKGSPSALKGE